MTKTILITGGTDGIGLLTAKKLAALGHRILLHGRDAKKLESAKAAVGANCEVHLADLSKVRDVDAMADGILSSHDRLDVLINNAGVLKAPHVETENGRDIRFEVNTLAPYVLALRLLGIVPSDGRIVNLSSAAQALVDVSAMTRFRAMTDMDAYAQSKLAITIWSQKLADALPDGPVVVSVNPGSLLASKMVQEGFGISGNDLNIGADILVRAALSDEFAGASGKYFDNDAGRFNDPHAGALEAEHANSVMQAIERLTGLPLPT